MTMGGMEPRKPSQVRESNGLMSLVMGRSGAGKTSLLETLWLPDGTPTEYLPLHVLDYDGKSHVLRDHDELEVFFKPTWKQTDDFVQEFERAGKHPKAKTICFDGTTMLQNVTHKGTNVFGTDNPQLRASRYGEANNNMVELASRCKILSERGINIIFNIWSWAEKEDEQDQFKKVLPDITPTLQNKFVGQFDYIVFLERNAPPNVYPPVMRTGGSERYGTNTAVSPECPLRDAPNVIYRPSWKSIFDSFHGKPWNTEAHKK